MNKHASALLLLFTSWLTTACIAQPLNESAFEANARLGRAINFGNALEAPNEGDWGMVLQENYFELVKEAGFNSIRLPIKFSAHAGTNAPYTLHSDFLARVDWAVEQALSHDLNIIIDLHHYDELFIPTWSAG